MSINSLVETIRERLNPKRGGLLHPDDQARLSWARVAATYAEVPEIYRGFFDALPVGEKEPFPYTVISPTFKGFLQPENEKLVARVGDSLCVLEQKNGNLDPRRYPLAEIFLLETGTILLNSWFTFRGLDSSGAAGSSTIRFNSVTEHLFAPFVEWFRAAFQPAGQAVRPAAETSPFDALADVNFKFMNFGRKTVPPGEPILQIIFQPEIRKTIFAFLGFGLSRRIASAHMAILTGSDLIWIRDDPSQKVKAKTPYGGIWNYIPLSKIESVLLAPGADDLLELSVHLPKNHHVVIPYEEARRGEAEKLRGRILENSRG
jgi:hypothetical protein